MKIELCRYKIVKTNIVNANFSKSLLLNKETFQMLKQKNRLVAEAKIVAKAYDESFLAENYERIKLNEGNNNAKNYLTTAYQSFKECFRNYYEYDKNEIIKKLEKYVNKLPENPKQESEYIGTIKSLAMYEE